ncbi:MAG: HEAT repeat domain-containing protein [Usitatibacter sp.]
MAPVSSSDPALVFAVAVTVGALASALLLLASIVALRGWRRWNRARLAHCLGPWRAALHEATEDPRVARLPPITARDLPEFTILWNHFQESLRGDAAENLAVLLRAHAIPERLLAMLDRRALRLRLVAIIALGHLREERAWARLEFLAREPGPVISFAAARALLRIEPRRALEVLSDTIVGRDDWPLARLGTIFQELGPTLVTPAIVNMLGGRSPRGLTRAIKLSRFAHRTRVAGALRALLSSSADTEVLVAVLDVVEDAVDLPWVRGAAKHSEWPVRMASARALGRVGERRELGLLLELLGDRAWWVRYHAGRAITHLHGLEAADLESLREQAPDAFARDMLAQAIAERARA